MHTCVPFPRKEEGEDRGIISTLMDWVAGSSPAMESLGPARPAARFAGAEVRNITSARGEGQNPYSVRSALALLAMTSWMLGRSFEAIQFFA